MSELQEVVEQTTPFEMRGSLHRFYLWSAGQLLLLVPLVWLLYFSLGKPMELVPALFFFSSIPLLASFGGYKFRNSRLPLRMSVSATHLTVLEPVHTPLRRWHRRVFEYRTREIDRFDIDVQRSIHRTLRQRISFHYVLYSTKGDRVSIPLYWFSSKQIRALYVELGLPWVGG